jgi:hypothetical protein
MVTPLVGAGVVLCTTGVLAEGAGATVLLEGALVVGCCACAMCAVIAAHNRSAILVNRRKVFFL